MTRIHGVWGEQDVVGHLTLIGLIVAAVGQVGFVVMFMRRPWWTVPPGRALMLKSATIGAILALTILNTFFIYPHEAAISMLVMWSVALAIVYQWVALLRTPAIYGRDIVDDDTPESDSLLDGPPSQQ